MYNNLHNIQIWNRGSLSSGQVSCRFYVFELMQSVFTWKKVWTWELHITIESAYSREWKTSNTTFKLSVTCYSPPEDSAYPDNQIKFIVKNVEAQMLRLLLLFAYSAQRIILSIKYHRSSEINMPFFSLKISWRFGKSSEILRTPLQWRLKIDFRDESERTPVSSWNFTHHTLERSLCPLL